MGIQFFFNYYYFELNSSTCRNLICLMTCTDSLDISKSVPLNQYNISSPPHALNQVSLPYV